MSWALSAIGSKPGCLDRIAKDAAIPQVVKDTIVALVNSLPERYGIEIATNGHLGDESSSCNINIRSIEVL